MRVAGLVILASLCGGCAVTRVGKAERLTLADRPATNAIEVQRYRITGVLPGGGAIRLTGRDDAGHELSPSVRYWIAPLLISGGAILLNGILVGTPTIWHLVAGRPDYLPTPDRWCLTTLVGSCRVLIEEPADASSHDVANE